MSRFQTTRWSLVLEARGDSGEARRALETLCRIYRPPVLAFIVRRGHRGAEAEDLTQAFFEQLLRLQSLAVADPLRGRMRVFLQVMLRRFLARQEVAARAGKRGGGAAVLAFDDEVHFAVAQEGATPDAAFDRDWAEALVRQAMSRLQAEAEAAGKGDLFRALKPWLLDAPGRDEVAPLAERLGMRGNTLAVALHRMRRRLQEHVRAEVADTVDDPDGVQDELQAMRRAGRRPTGG